MLYKRHASERQKAFGLLKIYWFRHGGGLNSPRFCIFRMSKVGAPLMDDTADTAVYSEINTSFQLIL